MSTAESLTGGVLAARLTGAPGASDVFLGGVVAYATDVKISVLGVPASLVEEYGVVSAECALAMAQGVRNLTGSTYAVSTTGVAGPTQQEGKPVGTVYLGLCGPSSDESRTLALSGDRSEIVGQTVDRGLAALVDLVSAAAAEPGSVDGRDTSRSHGGTR